MADVKHEPCFDDEGPEIRDDQRLLYHDMQTEFQQGTKNVRRRVTLLLLLAFLVNLTWTLCLVWNTLHRRVNLSEEESSTTQRSELIYSPATEAIRYEVIETNLTIDSTNIYMGKPRPEQTSAWEEITKWRNIAVSKHDLAMINQTSIELADGSGYLATLEVFHHVHCLDFIRMYIFRDYYDTHEPEHLRWQHVDHCIEVLRETVMCQADLSPITWQWVDRQKPPFANFNVKHECRNWDNILEWTKNHQAAPEAIIRPPSQPWPPQKTNIRD